jgi:hypothetical protein
MTIGSKGCRSHRHAWLLTPALTVGLCTVMLAGCDRPDRGFVLPSTDTYSSKVQRSSNAVRRSSSSTARPSRIPIQVPERALLEPRPEPQCQFEGTDGSVDERWKLDYERQCYRQAEMIVRYRLELLQNAVHKMIEQTERDDRPSGRSSAHIFARRQKLEQP